MLTDICPKLPMRNKADTKHYYIDTLGFKVVGTDDFDFYLMVKRENIEIHFFEFKELVPSENYGQVYIRTNDIDTLYKWMLDNHVTIHPNGKLQNKPWGQREFALLDPDNNLLTFGQSL
jgi:catechol 2,3-dioxygenase-like lactoylglutathione lyase family enzyme